MSRPCSLHEALPVFHLSLNPLTKRVFFHSAGCIFGATCETTRHLVCIYPLYMSMLKNPDRKRVFMKLVAEGYTVMLNVSIMLVFDVSM